MKYNGHSADWPVRGQHPAPEPLPWPAGARIILALTALSWGALIFAVMALRAAV